MHLYGTSSFIVVAYTNTVTNVKMKKKKTRDEKSTMYTLAEINIGPENGPSFLGEINLPIINF